MDLLPKKYGPFQRKVLSFFLKSTIVLQKKYYRFYGKLGPFYWKV